MRSSGGSGGNGFGTYAWTVLPAVVVEAVVPIREAWCFMALTFNRELRN
jgi:hypothetical protein